MLIIYYIMSTNNFYSNNTTHIYSIDCENEFEFDDTVSNIQYDLPKLWKKTNEYEDSLESYPGNKFAYFEIWDSIAGYALEIVIVAVVREGYYAGANFDYSVNYKFEGEYCDTIEAMKQDFLHEMKCNGKAGLGQMLVNQNHFANLENEAQSAIRDLEKVYSEYTNPIKCTGVFSNGEAIYTAA